MEVGRLYISVPASLEQIAQNFCLDIATISSYKLGHTELSVAADADTALLTPNPSATAQPAEHSDTLQLASNHSQLHIAALEERIRSLELDMTKVQNMLLLHSEQLAQDPGHA